MRAVGSTCSIEVAPSIAIDLPAPWVCQMMPPLAAAAPALRVFFSQAQDR